MFFLNLTAGEFLALLGALGGLITTLYLLDRTRRKKVVSSLRFWAPALSAEQQRSRKRVREPWSLFLQLASLLLLLLAIAQLEWGTREGRGRDHVVLLDTSSWAGQQNSNGTVLDREKAAARQYLAALPGRDRVMLVRVDALSVPVTPFTADRSQLLKAIRDLRPAFSALNISQALSFAQQARAWSGGEGGEIVYLGPKLVENASIVSGAAVPKLNGLRVIFVPSSRENCGIRRIAVKRTEDEANSWQATVTLKNYGAERRAIHLLSQFAGTVFAPRALTLRPGQEAAAQYNFVTNTAGRFTAAIDPHDSLSADDQASLALPDAGLLRVAVFTNRPDVLHPLFDAYRGLSVRFLSPSAYTSNPAADVLLLDQFAPPERVSSTQSQADRSKLPSLWIQPPSERSPIPIKALINKAVITVWHSDATIGAGLHAKETQIGHAEVFQTFDGDQPLASVAEGPIVVLRIDRNNQQKQAVIGFDPLSGAMRFEVTAPLLFANLLRWLSPEAFRTVEITAGRVGTATIELDKSETPASLRATDEKGFAVPFTVRNQTLELFASRPSVVRVTSDNRDHLLSLTLPDVAEVEWKPAGSMFTGVPSARVFASSSIDLWHWLAVLGGLGLLCEWLLFGRRRVTQWRTALAPSVSGSVPGHSSPSTPTERLVFK